MKISESIEGFFDKLLFNLASREFQVFLLATLLLLNGVIGETNWMYCALGYIGVRTMQKFKEWDTTKKT